MRNALGATIRMIVLVAIAGLAIYAAYTNVNDEPSFSDETKLQFLKAWCILPSAAVLVYLLTAIVSKGSSLSFRPAVSLSVVYALVYSFYAFTGIVDATRGGRTQYLFIPIILGVFSLPFYVFMLDRIFSIVRSRVRGEEPTHGRRPKETR